MYDSDQMHSGMNDEITVVYGPSLGAFMKSEKLGEIRQTRSFLGSWRWWNLIFHFVYLDRRNFKLSFKGPCWLELLFQSCLLMMERRADFGDRTNLTGVFLIWF